MSRETPEEQWRFANLSTAQQWAREHDRMIYCELFGQVGVFQIYPGGRTIKWPATERYWKRLTPESVFRNAAAKARKP